MASSPTDALDRSIIFLLQQDARRPITDLANELGVADNTVRNRIQKLEAEDVIRGYSVDVNYESAGVQHYYLFSCTARVSEREQLAEDARHHPAVVEVVTFMTGNENVSILAAASRKADITALAYSLDELGLHIEREHLIWEHFRQPFSEFAREGDR